MNQIQDPIELEYSAEHGLMLDLYLSENSVSDPVAVYIHGGGFMRGDKADDAPRLRSLRDHGLNVASINYRLAPASHYPEPVDDVRQAVAFLRRDASKLRINGERIGVIGASAGGFLASAAAVDHGGNPECEIQAASPWFAASDFVESTRRSPLEERIEPVRFELNLFGDSLTPSLLADASPARRDLSQAPPFLLLHGDSDKVVPFAQAEIMHRHLSHHGRESTLIRLAGAGHEDPRFDSGAIPGLVAGWMRAQLVSGPADSEVI